MFIAKTIRSYIALTCTLSYIDLDLIAIVIVDINHQWLGSQLLYIVARSGDEC